MRSVLYAEGTEAETLHRPEADDRRPSLEVRPAGRRYGIYAGASLLRKGFRSEAQALAALEENRAFYAYWAGSVSVSVDNTPGRVISA